MGMGEMSIRGSPAMEKHPIQGGVEILLVASCYRNRDKLRPDGPLGSYAHLVKESFIALAFLLVLLKHIFTLIFHDNCTNPRMKV